jgi:hypothetical protein
MANRFLNNIKINDSYTLPAADGTADQVITTDGSGQLSFVDQSTLAVDSAEVVEVPVKNLQGSALTKGDPVYISGSVGSSGRLEVQLADAGNTAKMPAVGLLKQDLAVNGEGYVVVTGKLRNLVTSPIDGATPSEGDVLYVKSGGSTGAALTTTKPTGTNLIQNMGKVGRVSTSSDGTFVVSSILRANDVPTPLYVDHSNQRLGIGETSPGTILDIKGANPYVTINTTSTYTSWGIKAESSGNSKGRLEWVSNSFLQFGAGVILTSGSSYIQIPDSTTYDFHLNLVGNRVMQIDSGTGTVGIGTTVGLSAAPAYGVQPNLVLGSDTSTTGGVLSLYNYDTTIEAGDTLGIIQFVGKDDASSSSGYTAATIRTYTNTAMGQGNPGGGEMVFSTAGTIAGSSPAERMRIDSSGNVGIGTNDPDGRLHIATSGESKLDIEDTGGQQYRFFVRNSDKVFGIYDVSNPLTWFRYTGNATVANTKLALLEGGGNVGIGTTSPSYKLTVDDDTSYGGIMIQGGNAPALTLLDETGTAKSLIYAQSTASAQGILRLSADDNNTGTDSTIEFRVDGTERMRIDSNGNVGIGTNNPIGNLEVNTATVRTSVNGGADELVIQNDGYSGISIISSATTAGQIHFGDVNQSNTGMIQYFHSDNSMRFATGDALEKMRIDSSGNVGIGTTSPATLLQLSSNNPVLTVTDNESTYRYAGLALATNGGTWNLSNGDSTTAANSNLYITRNSAGTDNRFIFHRDNYYFGVYDNTNTIKAVIRANGDSYFNGGNVGVGTTNPSAKVHASDGGTIPSLDAGTMFLASNTSGTGDYSSMSIMSGTAGIASLFFGDTDAEKRGAVRYLNSSEEMRFRTANTDRVSIKGNGLVGIGTTNPSAKLHVDQTVNAQGIRVESDNVQPSITFVDGATSDYWEVGYNRSGERLVFEYNNTELAVLRENGNFGVGAGLIPSSKLHVDGTGRFNDYVIAGSGSGGVGLTDNDGYGNANVTFNHVNGTPEQNGQSARIKVNTDNTTDEATMEFEVSSSPVTSGTALNLPVGLKLAHDYAEIPYRLTHAGDTDTYLQFDTDRIRLAAGGTTFLDSNITYTNGTGTADRVPKWSDSDTLTDSVIREASSSIGIGKSPQSGFILDANGAAVIRGNVYTSGDITKFNSGALIIRNSVSGQPITFATENTSERMRITSAGNVGIGTTSPSSKLHVSGTGNQGMQAWFGNGFINNASYHYGFARVGFSVEDEDGADTGAGFQFNTRNSTDSNWLHGYIYQPQDGGMAFGAGGAGTTAATEKMRITSTGNVGIGTDNPAVSLHVDGFARFNGGLQLDGNNRTIYAIDNTSLLLGTNNTERMRINSSGNVGIGTTNPSERLHVIGKTQIEVAAGNVWMDLINSSESAFRLRTYNNGTGSGTSAYAFKHGLYYNTTENAAVTFWRGGSSTGGFLTFTTNNGTERMRINSSGNVGIGETSVDARLHVTTASAGLVNQKFESVGSAAWRVGIPASQTYFAFDNANDNLSTPKVVIDSSGQVGIGTTNPSVQLDIEDSNNVLIDLNTTTANANTTIRFQENSSNTATIGYDGTSDGLILTTGGFTAGNGIFIDNSQNVGIGVTTPLDVLHVDGTIRAITPASTDWGLLAQNNVGVASSGIWFDNGDGELLLRDDANNLNVRLRSDSDSYINGGNVGIGTTSPSQKLQVEGNSWIKGIYYDTSGDAGASGQVLSSTATGTNWITLNDIYYTESEADSRFVNVTGDTMTGDLTLTGSHPRITLDSSGHVNLELDRASSSYDANLLFKTAGAIKWRIWNDGSDDTLGIRDEVNATEMVTFKTGGNVGIGTTSPDHKLTVYTDATSGVELVGQDGGNQNSDSSKIIFNGYAQDNGPFIQAINTSAYGIKRLGFFVSRTASDYTTLPTESMSITNAGNVGVGTTSPGERLTVNSNGSINSVLKINALDNRGASRYALQIDDNDVNSRGSVYIDTATGPSIITTGNVGIGTTSPLAKFHVQSGGLSTASGNYQFNALFQTQNSNSEILEIKSVRTAAGTDWTTAGKRIQMRIDSTYMGYMQFNGNSNSYGISFGTGYTTTAPGNVSERMRITSAGNVGIGTTSPSHALDVSGTIATDSGFLAVATQPSLTFVDSSGGGSVYTSAGSMYFKTGAGTPTNKMTILSGGNVGIGTDSPTSDLHISDSFPRITLQDTDGTNTVSYIDHDGSYLNLISRNGTNNGNIRFRRYDGTTTTNSMIINHLGKVGVGGDNPHGLLSSHQGQQTGSVFTNPNLALTSNTATDGGFIGMTFAASSAINYGYSVGAHRTSSAHSDFEINYHYNSAAGVNRFIIDQDGNIGMGATNPGYKLDVIGTIRATGDVIAYSDIRVKENIKTIDNALDKVKALRGVEYNKIDSSEKSIGVIAQEIEEIIPQVVKEDEAGMKSVAYGNITAVLIEAIKEQQKQIDQLKAIIDGSSK